MLREPIASSIRGHPRSENPKNQNSAADSRFDFPWDLSRRRGQGRCVGPRAHSLIPGRRDPPDCTFQTLCNVACASPACSCLQQKTKTSKGKETRPRERVKETGIRERIVPLPVQLVSGTKPWQPITCPYWWQR